MSYIDNNLISGESVIYRAHLHWIIFIWPIILLFAALFAFNINSDISPLAGRILLAIAIFTGLPPLIDRLTSEFGVTNKRVIVKVGFIRRDSLEILLSKVEGIQVKQTIAGKILGYGSIVISGTGGTRDPFHNISKPFEFRTRVQVQVAIVQK